MNTALHGKRILVTRPSAQAGPLARAIAAQGGEALRFALLEIAPAADDEPLQQAIARLDDYALAIFISPNAVHFSVPHILAHRPWPPALHAAAVGPGTAAELSACGITELIVPSQRFDSEALLELPALHATRVAGKKVLIVSSGGPISTAVGHVLGLSPERTIDLNMRIRNSSVTELQFGAKRHSLLTFNTLPHLDHPDLSEWVTFA